MQTLQSTTKTWKHSQIDQQIFCYKHRTRIFFHCDNRSMISMNLL